MVKNCVGLCEIAWDLRVESVKNYVELVWLWGGGELVFMFHVKHTPRHVVLFDNNNLLVT
jgi:hypothetical protein